MDNLTHTAVGLMLSRSGLGRWSPGAPLALMLSANAPDCDIVSLAGGAATYFQYHRWYTHSLLLLPLMAGLVVAACAVLRKLLKLLPPKFQALQKPMQWRKLYWLALLGVGTHLLLDLTNPYGIRLFLPWSDAWPALDCTSVVDLWIWAAILLAIAGPFLSRLVSSEIGARSTAGKGWAVMFLLFIVVFDAGRYMLAQRAVAVQQMRLYEGSVPRKVLIFPTVGNPLLWRGAVETDTFWSVHDVNLLTQFDPTIGRLFYKPEPSPVIDAARNTPPFQHLIRFSRGLIWRVTPARDGTGLSLVRANDIRFGTPPDGGFQASAIVDSRGLVQRSWFSLRGGGEGQ